MRVPELVKAVQSKFANSEFQESFILVIYANAKFVTETDEGEKAEGLGFDIIGPVFDIPAAELRIANVLDELVVQPYSIHHIHGRIDSSLNVNPNVLHWERDAKKRWTTPDEPEVEIIELCWCGAPVDQDNADCRAFNLCKDHAQDA